MAIFADGTRDNNGLLFEVDETGNQEVVRSINSEDRVYVRFTNASSRPLNIWWRDFEGQRQYSAKLEPGEFCDMNTFATHPWEFTDKATGERFFVGEHVIFRAPKMRGTVPYRTNWNITIGMRSLRDTALMQVALRVTDASKVPSLGLPRVLAEDLGRLVDVLHRPQTLRESLE